MRITCIILCGLGVALGLILMQLHSTNGVGKGLIARTCEAVGGCNKVISSRWAYFPPPGLTGSPDTENGTAPSVEPAKEETSGRIPVALLGLGYFAALMIWFSLVGKSTRLINGLILTGIALGCGGSAWFIYLMLYVIGAECPFCAGSHLVNFLLLIAALIWFLRRKPVTAKPKSLYVGAATVVLSSWVMIGLGWWLHSLQSENRFLREALTRIQEDIHSIELVWQNEAKSDLGIRDEGAGVAEANFDPVIDAEPGYRNTVVMFGDAECPACLRFHDFLIRDVQPLYNGHLRVVWKHLPLTDIHPNAMPSAQALEAARLQGKFWDYLDKLHEKQDVLHTVDYAALAADSGMNPEEFRREMDSPYVDLRIQGDIKTAEALGISGTPAVYLNSRRVDGSIRNLIGFWQLQARRLKELRLRKGQDWNGAVPGEENLVSKPE